MSVDSQLSVRGLCKAWGSQAILRDISFDQAAGTIFGVAGDNGAGKSTLLKILASVLPRDGGQIYFGGLSLDDRNRWRRQVGYVPQELALDDRLKVKETLAFWAAARGFSRQQVRQLVTLAASDPLIAGFLHKPLRECSGGMARRVSLIVGLMGDPSLILLDEPLAGTDRESRDLILERLAVLRSRGHTLLISGHEDSILTHLCDRVLRLSGGGLVSSPADS